MGVMMRGTVVEGVVSYGAGDDGSGEGVSKDNR